MNGGECYLYDPDICDGQFCVGDCDKCSVWEQGDEYEID